MREILHLRISLFRRLSGEFKGDEVPNQQANLHETFFIVAQMFHVYIFCWGPKCTLIDEDSVGTKIEVETAF